MVSIIWCPPSEVSVFCITSQCYSFINSQTFARILICARHSVCMVLGTVQVNRTDAVSAITSLHFQWSECGKCILAAAAPFLFLTAPGSEEGNIIAVNPERRCKVQSLTFFWLSKVSSEQIPSGTSGIMYVKALSTVVFPLYCQLLILLLKWETCFGRAGSSRQSAMHTLLGRVPRTSSLSCTMEM